ncbi:unnamed protein product [Gongylonema pulchrum]|uniref:Uncharacterized protein n=1 Tax=Gongylonema pulchrum TaxID=637853 RepID=A0A183DBH2_9BILA|nr:unnamed protein product [Gongylonema pulchrum]
MPHPRPALLIYACSIGNQMKSANLYYCFAKVVFAKLHWTIFLLNIYYTRCFVNTNNNNNNNSNSDGQQCNGGHSRTVIKKFVLLANERETALAESDEQPGGVLYRGSSSMSTSVSSVSSRRKQAKPQRLSHEIEPHSSSSLITNGKFSLTATPCTNSS